MKWKALKHWLVNNFWYHYKWHTLGILTAALFVFFFVWEMTHKEYPDVHYAVVVEALAGESQLEEIDRIAKEEIGDVNGDGQAIVYNTLLSYGDPSLAVANRQRFPLLFIDNSYQLIIMDATTFAQDSWEDVFTPWTEVGLPSANSNPFALDVTQWPVFARAKLTEESLYACLKKLDDKDREDALTVQMWEASLRLIQALMERA